MKLAKYLGLLAGVSAIAVQSAQAQDTKEAAAPDDRAIVVTGSRLITNGDNSPTPVTTLTTQALLQAKPTTVYEALLDQPLMAASKGGKFAGGTGQGGNNNSIAGLNIRGLGPTRSLVLLDGHRVPPQNLDGQVDLNQIPQLLLQRVDLQTGGSSAVYGSDAIAGTVNFIIDRKFKGLKLNVSGGISQRGDEPTYDFAGAWGKDLFEGRGHFEASVEYRYDGGLLRTDRANVQQAGKTSYSLQGNGCPGGTGSAACVPYFVSNTAVDGSGSFGGLITQVGTVKNPFAGYNFTQNGIATPFVAGTPVGVGTNQLGGQGGYLNQLVSLAARSQNLQTYARFDFDVNEHLHFYLSGYYDRVAQFTWLQNMRGNQATAGTGFNTGYVLTPQNAFLPANIASAMTAAGVKTFTLGKYFDVSDVPATNTNYTNQNLYLTTGLEGKFGRYNWQVGYVGSRVTQTNIANGTWNTANLLAGLDSVNVNGVPTCWVSTQPQYAGNFPGCVPINPFGPTSMTAAQQAYVLQPTKYTGTTSLMDFAGSIDGSPFDTWAGPFKVALSAEYRKLGYNLVSGGAVANVSALDCNGLGLLTSRTSCVAQSATNIGTAPIYPNGIAGRSPVDQKVAEAAIEINVPLLKDVRFARDVSFNGAARYAHYSSDGSVDYNQPYSNTKFHAVTWKAGLVWKVSDAVTLRATQSRDFRAPNLSDLYLPGRAQGLAAGTDYLTGAQIGVTQIPGANGSATYSATQQIGGNPNLKPEVDNTTTVGIVLKPMRRMSIALDYYNITINNAITIIDGSSSTAQQACYASGGASPYCALQVRPNGYTDKSLANAASLFYISVPLNVSKLVTRGLDFEGNYAFDIGSHPFTFRLLGSYQPTLKSIQPGYATTDQAGVSVPKLRVQGSLRIGVTDDFHIDWTTRWRSMLRNVDPLLGLQVAPGSENVPSASFSSINFSLMTKMHTEFYLNIQNVFDAKPPVYAPLSGVSALAGGAGGNGVGFYPGDDVVGRYFLMGARMKF